MKIIFTLLTVLAISQVAAQQDPLYAQYTNNPFVLNPAYAGLNNNLNASLSYRQQWTGFEGSPVTINANAHTSLLNSTMGAGLMIISDQIGITSVNEVYASYVYRINITNDKKLSFGLQAGLINFKTKNADLNIQDPNDPFFSGETNETKPGIGSGIILTGEKFFIGLSVPRMLKTKTDAGEVDLTLFTQHFYAMTSYMFFVSDRIGFKPSVLAKIVEGAPASMDINAAVILNGNYTVGFLTRNFSTYGVFLQALIKKSLLLGYAMEMPTNASVGPQFFTHEITLGLRLNLLPSHTGGATSF